MGFFCPGFLSPFNGLGRSKQTLLAAHTVHYFLKRIQIAFIDAILQSQFQRVDVQGFSDDVHLRFHPPQGFGITKPPVGTGHPLIGIHAIGIQTEVFDPVICSRSECGVACRQVTGSRIGAAHQEQPHLIGHDGPVFFNTGLNVHNIMGPARRRAQMLLPGELHFDRPLRISLLGQGQRGGDLFGLGIPPTETSAHMGRDDDPHGR